MSHEQAQPLPFAIAADADDVEVAALIESWRYRGPAVSWDAVVGHAPQVRRCQEIVEALRRPEADLERLRIRLGSGILLAGAAGVGKTLSGAEIAVAVEEAMSRSLLTRTDALTAENLLAIVGERYVIADPSPRRLVHEERTARHEAAHALYAHRRWPGAVAMVSLRGEQPGTTSLDEERLETIDTAAGFRDLAGMALAGLAAEMLLYGAEGVSSGSSADQAKATGWLLRSREVAMPYDRDVLERGQESDRGSERMRAALHAAVEDDAARLLAEVVAELAPHRSAIESLAEAVLAADDQTLSGVDLTAAIEAALA